MQRSADVIRERIAAIYRQESRRVFASLVRLLGGFDLAEEALHDAFVAAAQQWPRDGEPGNPRAWLVSTGRFKALDRLRRRVRLDRALKEVGVDPETPDPSAWPDPFALEEETVAANSAAWYAKTSRSTILAPISLTTSASSSVNA